MRLDDIESVPSDAITIASTPISALTARRVWDTPAERIAITSSHRRGTRARRSVNPQVTPAQRRSSQSQPSTAA